MKPKSAYARMETAVFNMGLRRDERDGCFFAAGYLRGWHAAMRHARRTKPTTKRKGK